MRLLMTAATIALAAAFPAATKADFIFEFGSGGASPGSSFSIAEIGDEVAIDVYLREYGGSVLATEQLFSATVEVVSSDPTIAAVSGVVASSAFDIVFTTPVAGGGQLSVAALLNPLVDPDGMGRVFLGTFTFVGLSAGAVTISATVPSTGFDEVITGTGTVLDGQIDGGSATLAVVPEPGSLLSAGLGLAALAGLVGWRRARTLGTAS